MMKLKENASLLIVKMKKISYLLVFILMVSCTSNTIFEEPKDLIPKDTMSLLIQEMMIASSSKHVKNNNLEKKIEYMYLVYDNYKIDSGRFKTSNAYYMSKIDVYQEIFENAKSSLEKQKEIYEKINDRLDSIKSDSLNKIRQLGQKKRQKMDSLRGINLKTKPAVKGGS